MYYPSGHAEDHYQLALYEELSRSTYIMSNEELKMSAMQIHSGILTPTQRALNHRWLQEQENIDENPMGSKAIRKLAQRYLKGYITEGRHGKQVSGTAGIRNYKALPASDGFSKVVVHKTSFDYDIKLSSKKFRVDFEFIVF
jgi:hypothetical protein